MRPFKGPAATLLTITKGIIAALCVCGVVFGVRALSSEEARQGIAQARQLLGQYHMTPEAACLAAKTALRVGFGEYYTLIVSAIAVYAVFLALALLRFVWDTSEGVLFLFLRITQKGRKPIAVLHVLSCITAAWGAVTSVWCGYAVIRARSRIDRVCEMANMPEYTFLFLLVFFAFSAVICLFAVAFHNAARRAILGRTNSHFSELCVFFGIGCASALCGALFARMPLPALVAAVFALRFFAAARCHRNARRM